MLIIIIFNIFTAKRFFIARFLVNFSFKETNFSFKSKLGVDALFIGPNSSLIFLFIMTALLNMLRLCLTSLNKLAVLSVRRCNALQDEIYQLISSFD